MGRPRLATIARAINEKLPVDRADVRATTMPWSTSTDYKPRGFRYITRTGRGRNGTKFELTIAGNRIIDHASSEPYRHNGEVMSQVEDLFGRIWEDDWAQKQITAKGKKLLGPADRSCCVVNEECKHPPGCSNRCRSDCFGCGLPVCTASSCSKRVLWYRHGRRRVCVKCIEDHKY